MNQNKKGIFLDIIFFLAFPFLIWKVAKTHIDPYYAMLISSIPTILYTFYCLKKERQLHITSLYILINLFASTIVDLLSGSAERMLWNNVYYQIALGFIVIGTIFIKKPLILYFAVDIAALQGHEREKIHSLFRDKRIYSVLQYLTLFSGIQTIAKSCLKIYFISVFGVEGYGEIRAIMTAIDWGLSICIGIGGFAWIDHKVNLVIGDSPPSLEQK
ncbi:hypothetical protein P4T48_19335 [Bacillus paramycoides]|uniref:VC0807 family protein n=1 Tax=Bacillus paramycoides TaxID=2026194 RepID=UPI002E20EBC2|nr:hypothetical protein [Bacillus paramycoides]